MEAITRSNGARHIRQERSAAHARASGTVPAVVYGGDGDEARRRSPSIRKALLKILHSESGANTLISLQARRRRDARVLVKEYQLDPITHQLLHADFYRVAMDKMLQRHGPGHRQGRAEGRQAAGRHRSTSSAARSRSSACRPTFPSTSTSTSAS